MNRFALILLIALLTACARQEAAKQASAAPQAAAKPAPIPVRAAAAETRTIPRTIDVVGQLIPDETTNLTTEVPGRITEIRFDFGHTVRKGDIVVQLDRAEFQIQLDRTKAALAQALARVGLEPDQEDAQPRDTPAVRSARAQWEDAKQKFDTAKKLHESGDIPRERFIEIEKLVNSRQAALDLARDDMRTQMANILVIKAERRLQDKRLADTTVRAPFDGIVSAKLVSPGQYVKDNIPLITLVKTWPLRVRVDVPEAAAAHVHHGAVLTFTNEALPGKEFQATVTQVNPAIDARARALSAEARMNAAAPALKPGMFVQIKLAVAKGAPVTVAPRDAVYNIAGLYKVFTIDGNRAREHRIAPGETMDGWVALPDGVVRPGESVAVSNLANLVDNAEVSVTR